jgi:hypothetical protein
VNASLGACARQTAEGGPYDWDKVSC